MKKFGLLLAGGLAAIILFATIGPMIGLLISFMVLYFIYKQFLKTKSTIWKVTLLIFGFIVLSSAIHHIPALIGVGATYIIYLVYMEWNKKAAVKEETDPFVNFEEQWEQLKKF
jgi:lia operon protein LiaI